KRLGGSLVQAPRLGWSLGFCAMASLGLPGLAGFWGEFPAILSSFTPAQGLHPYLGLFRGFMVAASVGTVLAAGYLLWMAWVPMLLLIVALGVYPHLVFRVTDGAVHQATHMITQVAAAGGG